MTLVELSEFKSSSRKSRTKPDAQSKRRSDRSEGSPHSKTKSRLILWKTQKNPQKKWREQTFLIKVARRYL